MRWWFICVVFGSMLYCEFLGDYFILQQCSWPTTNATDSNKELRVMLLADPHLLGPFKGHWLDKLYREWHMHRAFQAAMHLHRPEIVFVLGDLFDEGDFVDHEQFEAYVHRFHQHFYTPSGTTIISAVGNHDVGFHYKMNPFYTKRFDKHFSNTGAKLYTFKEIHFVLINSMAMEGDGCQYCEATMRDLNDIAARLDCLKDIEKCEDRLTLSQHISYSRPIVLQHFPTYRISDNSCREYDAPKFESYKENWEVLSKKSTDWLGTLLRPRLAFGGHSHHYCFSINRWGSREYTIASFSWRNKENPSFLMATISKTRAAILKCHMLPQASVVMIYTFVAVLCMLLLLLHIYRKIFKSKLRRAYAKLQVQQ